MPAERTPGRNKSRLDVLLHERELVESRTKAQALIRAGDVFVDGQRVDKPGALVKLSCVVIVRDKLPFVSRAGAKLAAALDAFQITPAGVACLDVGASTGGFTDCLLQRGARCVYAVDVGRAQLAWSLRSDPRVINMERTDIRDIEALPETIALATADVAFISLSRVLPTVMRLLDEGGVAVVLVKPQFEAGRDLVGRRGLVTDPAIHEQVLHNVLELAITDGWRFGGVRPSPVTGATGNREFLALLAMPAATIEHEADLANAVRAAAHDEWDM